MHAYLYVLGASKDPNFVECSVPYAVDADEIFFGPCKKMLRESFRRQHLRDHDDVEPKDDIYLIGFNGLGPERERRIVWVGRIKRFMTFARAWDVLNSPRYDQLRTNPSSPLHLRPVRAADGALLGYEHRSELHAADWDKDVAAPASSKVRLDGRQLLIARGETEMSAFPRDCCFLLDNVFAAEGAGIPLDDAIVELLRRAQPGKSAIDSVAVFGYQADGGIEGKQGRWLHLGGSLAEQLVGLLPSRIDAARSESKLAARRPTRRPVMTCGCSRGAGPECDESEAVEVAVPIC